MMRTTFRALIAAAAFVPAGLMAQAKAPAIDDAAIVGIFDIANTWDIATGSLAAQRASRQDVKDFGAMLARDHKMVQGQGRDLAAKLKVTPTPVANDFALKVQHEAAMKKLQGLSGPAFDKAFLEHEVAYHGAVIDAVTKSFLPAIKSAELKAFVEKVAPAFVAHKQAAEQLLKGMAAGEHGEHRKH
jgi:putative membrane protein